MNIINERGGREVLKIAKNGKVAEYLNTKYYNHIM
jgi:hypothetical protein